MIRPRVLVTVTVATALSLGLLSISGCSDDEKPDDSPSSLVKPTTTTTTTEVGVTAPTSTFLPNTPVVAGREAILTGTYSQEPARAQTADVCHYVTLDDGTKVNVAFTTVYQYLDDVFPGPEDYIGDPTEYADDPLLVHVGDRIAVRGEVVEVGDDPCTAPTDHQGLTVLVSTFAPS